MEFTVALACGLNCDGFSFIFSWQGLAGSGALFAFVTAFDETVLVQFLAGPGQRTLAKQMFTGIREEVSPTITATVLILVATLLLTAVGPLRRRSERLRA